MSDAVVGTEVDGYRIDSVLGRGGMGTVYKAEDVNLSRTVAIKRINPGQQERESFMHRFRAEAQALARIDSSNIVGVYALRDTDIGLLIVMEYVEGGTLKDPIEQHGALGPGQAVPILEQTLQAFDDAHSEGVIHRDIKPENVMLTTEGIVKVTDFGIAKLRQPDSGETVTQGGQGGTLKYMSPEQISNIDAVDARSDIYSLGMTAYKVLAGRLPFKESDTDFDIMRKVVEGEIPPPDEFNPDIPSGLAQWIMGAIERQQEDRYQSAEEMLEALRDAHQQSADQTRTQLEWEVDDGSTDVDETQTVASEEEDRTQTVAPGEDDADDTAPVETGGETVMRPDATREEGAIQSGPDSAADPPKTTDDPSVDDTATEDTATEDTATEEDPATGDSEASAPEADSESRSVEEQAEPVKGTKEASEEDGTNWGAVGGSVVVGILLIVGGYIAATQMGGGQKEDGQMGNEESSASATLSLVTVPEGATVLVNGDTAGTTPLDEHTMEAGVVQLQVRKDGFVPRDTTFTVEAGEQIGLEGMTLARAPSDDQAVAEEEETKPDSDPSPSREAQARRTASAESTEVQARQPASAESTASTASAASEPTAEAESTPDRSDAGESSSTSEDSPPTDAAEEDEPSSPAMGTVSVTPKPSGVLLVDGEERGGTSVDVPVGEHTVACRHPKHGSVETTVTVTEGSTERLTCYFEQQVSVNTDGAFGRIWLNGTNTDKNTNAASPLSLTPGTHRIEVRRRSIDDFEVKGGVVKVTRGENSKTKQFSGKVYELRVEPTFERVTHAVVFNVETS